MLRSDYVTGGDRNKSYRPIIAFKKLSSSDKRMNATSQVLLPNRNQEDRHIKDDSFQQLRVALHNIRPACGRRELSQL